MYQANNELVFSPTGLTLYMESSFALWMEHFNVVCPDRMPEPDERNQLMGVLQDKGDAHEQAVLNGFIEQRLSVETQT